MFTPRLNDENIRNLKAYCDNSWNGYADTNSSPITNPSIIGNCVWYAIGRSAELANKSLRTAYHVRWGNASEFYDNSGLSGCEIKNWPRDSKPQVGDIVCWSGVYNSDGSDSGGHVEVVEEISNGYLTVSQSSYRLKFFGTRKYVIPSPGQKVNDGVFTLTFQGFIHNPYVAADIPERDSKKNQVNVIADLLRIRVTPNGTWTGFYAQNHLYDIYAFEKTEDYIWAKIGEDQWIALNDADGWTETFYANDNPDPSIIADLQLQVSTLKKKNAALESQIKQIKDILGIKEEQEKLDTIKSELQNLIDIL